MNNGSSEYKSRRFWILLVGVSGLDGTVAMMAYAFIYGYLRWPSMLDSSLPLGGAEFALVVGLIAVANLSLLARLYRFNAFDVPWVDRKFGPTLKEIAIGVLSLHFGGLGTIFAIKALSNGVSVFDRGNGHFAALAMAAIVIVIVTAPAIVYGERKLMDLDSSDAQTNEIDA